MLGTPRVVEQDLGVPVAQAASAAADAGTGLAQRLLALLGNVRALAARNLTAPAAAAAQERHAGALQATADRLNALALQLEGRARMAPPGSQEAAMAWAELDQLNRNFQPTISSLPQAASAAFHGRLSQVGRRGL